MKIILEEMLDKSEDIFSTGRESIEEWRVSLNDLELLIQSLQVEEKDECFQQHLNGNRFIPFSEFVSPESLDFQESFNHLEEWSIPANKTIIKFNHLEDWGVEEKDEWFQQHLNGNRFSPFSEFVIPKSLDFQHIFDLLEECSIPANETITKADELINKSFVPQTEPLELLLDDWVTNYWNSGLNKFSRPKLEDHLLESRNRELRLRLYRREWETLVIYFNKSANYTLLSSLPTEAKTVSHPPQVPSRPSDRNRKKRLKKKLKKKAKREEMDNNLLRSNCLLYMFASMHSGGYLLYRIDALEHARKSNQNNELLPLLVFGAGVLPAPFCTLVQMKDYIYFVGENPCDVFRIRKIDLKNLKLAEDNLGLEYLIPIKQPMQGPKRNPLVFVANYALYVISNDYFLNSYEFEMYSPTNSSWKDLNPKPKGHGSLKSHVVLNNIAYFATTDETVLSYNLSDGIWSIVSTAPKYPRTFCDIHPAFDAPVEIVGDMILGGFKLPSDFNITVAASPHPRCDDSVKGSFMRPTLAPDSKFWPEFARRFDYIRNNESHGSHYMTTLQTLDGQNILCFVSYGSNPSTDEPHRSYALLTFYKILGDHWKTSVRLKEEVLEGADKFCYYSRQVEAGNAVKSYFSLEFLNRKLFNISTTKLCTIGKLITCVAY